MKNQILDLHAFMKQLFIIILCMCGLIATAQQSSTFTHITREDGTGLASNVVHSLYQDHKGFIWIGTANGLQRFDGSKFVSFATSKPASDELPQSVISQIIPADSGRLILAMANMREFGIFDPATFVYKKLKLKLSKPVPARSQFWLYKLSDGTVYLTISGYGILAFDKKNYAFAEQDPFHLPKGWLVLLQGIYEDTIKQQYWIAADSGFCIYDKASHQLWTEKNNPANIPALNNKLLQDHASKFYFDHQRRLWVLGWSQKGQYLYCFDSTGTNMQAKDTVGIHTGPIGYYEIGHLYEPKKSGLWIYGNGVLFNWDKGQQRFLFSKSSVHKDDIGINYETIYQVIQDKDENLWLATDRGLYFTPLSNDAGDVVNLVFSNEKSNASITDILEMPNGDFWFASWGEGIRSVNKFFQPVSNDVYTQPYPKDWTSAMKGSTKLTWALCRESSTGNIWIGCNEGFLVIHDPAKKTSRFLQVNECDKRTIRFITEDKSGKMWIGTQSGRLIRYSDDVFNIVQDIGTAIYKIFIDKQGWMWLATHEKGLYAINPSNGSILQHYTTENQGAHVYSNTAFDIEQLNDSIIIYGGGVLNFVNKKTQSVRLLKYEDGLPSNSVTRLRMDKAGFLWIVTSNGLCRYNPNNNRITPYGRKDGVLLAEQTNVADYTCEKGDLVFGGSNAVVMFNPSVFLNNEPPPDVTITDFQLFSKYIPVDSLLQSPVIKMQHDQNSFTIYFASLSYMQRDKLTYYYKMEGLDKEWIKADRGYFVSYSVLPPGKYTFKVYCENLEGIRSLNTTSMTIHIKPPFWQTWWFRTSILFMMALVIYDLHNSRVKRLLAVEKLRNKVARDLHDDMGSTLSTINILTSMAITKMNSDAIKTTEYLGKISDNSQRMMEAMDDIVWSIKPSNDSMNKVIARMREFATNVLEAKEIDLEFTVEEKIFDIKLNMEARRDFFLVFKEAVNNAAKYSHAGKVAVHITSQSKSLVLSVKDDGVGFNAATADTGNGLGNMQKRAESLRGILKFESTAGHGTNVILKIPIS
jgi:signal transduction histidine kinase/ligand-binding sensor domain-containing protein